VVRPKASTRSKAVARPKAVTPPRSVTQPKPVAQPKPVVATEPVAQPEPVAEPEPVLLKAESVLEAEPVVVAPEPIAVPGSAGANDNLQRLEGIGPRIATVLTAAGIRTFDQLAACDQATLSATLRKGGVRTAPSMGTWTKQAELLAVGDEAGFVALTSQLVAGRRGR